MATSEPPAANVDPSRVTAGARYLNARSEMLEIFIAERRRQLVPRDEAVRMLHRVAAAAVADLKPTDDISAGDLRARLREAVDEAARHLTEGQP